VQDAAGTDDGGVAASPDAGGAGSAASGLLDAGTADATNGGAGAGASGNGGAGASGMGASGVGASGMGASGTGASGMGASGAGASGTGASGMGASGMGASGIGTAGTGNPIECGIAINATLSSAIATVGIVNWSTDLPNVDSAYIEFGLVETGPTMVAPVDLSAPAYRTLLLGMKQGRQYVYRVVASTGTETCTSEERMLTAGMLPAAPTVTRQVLMPQAVSAGFIVTSNRNAGNGGSAMIFDMDGDVVWFVPAPASTSRARMSYEGTDMWMLDLNVRNGGGEMRRVSMDGLEVENDASGLADAHHDFTVLPGGIVATAIWIGSGTEADNALIERAPDGTVTTVVENVDTLYASASGYHCNSIHYHPSDGTYTIGDRNPDAFVKVTRQGELLWQFGGSDPIGHHFPATWSVNHGHHVLPNGNVLFYNNGNSGSSMVREYALNEATWTATLVWDYPTSLRSPTLGDAQRLPNGNTLVTNSNGGLIEEVDPAGNVVQTFMAGGMGYADFRESLYGPPPR
jgi:hypothetical protein